MENNFQVISAAVTDRGLSEKRPQNEDSYLEMRNLGIFAVADGVGGAQAGEVASQMAMEILGEAFVNIQPNSDAEDVMKMAIESANQAIFQMSGDLPQLSMMATTIVALHLSGNIATIGHVGDSRLYRLDGRGSLYRETQDHSVVEEEVRAGRMTAAQAANHPSRNVISRALGAENTVEVDMKTIMIEPGTSFLLCSDGITRHITDFEIRELMVSNENPAALCDRMKTICYERGAEDNLTAVIIRVLGAPVRDTEVPPTTRLSDIEEPTVASPRPPVTAQIPPVAPVFEDEAPTARNLEMTPEMQSAVSQPMPSATVRDEDEDYLIQDDPEADYATDYAEYQASMSEQGVSVQNAPAVPATMSFKADAAESPGSQFSVETRSDESRFDTIEREPEKGGGIFGKLLWSLLLLVFGGVLGAGALFLYQSLTATNSTPPNLTPKTNDIPQTSIDALRAATPNQIIEQYKKTPPKDSADHYLLGRAYLSLKNYTDAKTSFIQARNLLKDVTSAEDKNRLATEITQGLIIAQNRDIQEAFEKEMKLIDGGSNVNSNTSANNNSDKSSDQKSNNEAGANAAGTKSGGAQSASDTQ